MPPTRVYYGDGTVSIGKPTEARGVQAIVQDHPEVGAQIVTGSDYYIFKGGRWWAVDQNGLYDFLLDSGIVLFGRMIGKEEYRLVVKQAMADKEGWLPFERKP